MEATRRCSAIIVLALGASSCELRQKASEPAEEAPVPVVTLDGPGLAAGRYKLVDLQVEVAATTGKGERWDGDLDPDPDLEIELRVDGERHAVKSCRSKDSVVMRCRPGIELDVDARTRIQLEVVDDDGLILGTDDAIGTATLADPSRWGIAMDLPLQPTGRVRAATLRLERVPTWGELYQWHIIGFVAGVAVALLVLGVFRRSLLAAGEAVLRAPDDAPPAPLKPRCGTCGRPHEVGLLICEHCGADL